VAERLPDEKPANSAEIDLVEDDSRQETKVGTMQVTSQFDEIVVWGHEALANAEEDPYIRSMDEWLQVAEKVSPTPILEQRAYLTGTDTFVPRPGSPDEEVMYPRL
jgi:hypothetical protein